MSMGMKSVEYLTAKVESLEKELERVRKMSEDRFREMKEDFQAEIAELKVTFGAQIDKLKEQTWSNTKWILIATGATSTVVLLSHVVDWYVKYLESKGHL